MVDGVFLVVADNRLYWLDTSLASTDAVVGKVSSKPFLCALRPMWFFGQEEMANKLRCLE